eukprot:4751321-Ditylum_brightwellii.AAC.1
MHTYQQAVTFMLMFQTEMPPDMPTDAAALGTLKLYMGQLAISIVKKILKTFEQDNVGIKDTNKLQ